MSVICEQWSTYSVSANKPSAATRYLMKSDNDENCCHYDRCTFLIVPVCKSYLSVSVSYCIVVVLL